MFTVRIEQDGRKSVEIQALSVEQAVREHLRRTSESSDPDLVVWERVPPRLDVTNPEVRFVAIDTPRLRAYLPNCHRNRRAGVPERFLVGTYLPTPARGTPVVDDLLRRPDRPTVLGDPLITRPHPTPLPPITSGEPLRFVIEKNGDQS